MSTAISQDPFKCFRFAPRFDFDGKAMGVSSVEIIPGNRWYGPGEVILEAAVWPRREGTLLEFATVEETKPLLVGVYHITDEFGADAPPPSLHIVLNNVTPVRCKMEIDKLDATRSDVFQVRLRMKYDRLTWLFGNNPLEQISAVT